MSEKRVLNQFIEWLQWVFNNELIFLKDSILLSLTEDLKSKSIKKFCFGCVSFGGTRGDWHREGRKVNRTLTINSEGRKHAHRV